VRDLLAVLKRTRHCGFPVVDVSDEHGLPYFSGLILRRQLLSLLHSRAWQHQGEGGELPGDLKGRFLSSARARYTPATLCLSATDKEQLIDLRPFMDPCPHLANELMPLRRVYPLFNQIGVRHLVVVDCREQVVGMVTRKDLLPEIIEERMLAGEAVRVAAAAGGGHRCAAPRRSSALEASAAVHSQGEQTPADDYPSGPTQLRPGAQRPGNRMRGGLPQLTGLVEAALQFGVAAAAAAAGSTLAKTPHQPLESTETVTLNRRGNRRKRAGGNGTVLLVRAGSNTVASGSASVAGSSLGASNSIDSNAGSCIRGSRKNRLRLGSSLNIIRIVRQSSSNPTPKKGPAMAAKTGEIACSRLRNLPAPSVEVLAAPMPCRNRLACASESAECERLG